MVNFNRVKELLAASCPYSAEEIELDSDLSVDLDFDSFCMMDMLLAFEKEYNISIPDRDLRLFVTVSDIVNYLEEKTA
jgi:acyl carrier protein